MSAQAPYSIYSGAGGGSGPVPVHGIKPPGLSGEQIPFPSAHTRSLYRIN